MLFCYGSKKNPPRVGSRRITNINLERSILSWRLNYSIPPEDKKRELLENEY